MDKNIIDFLNICAVKEILLLSNNENDYDNLKLDNTKNFSFLNINKNTNLSDIQKIISNKIFDLIILNSNEKIIDNVLSLLLKETIIPLIIFNSKNLNDSNKSLISKNNLSISPISRESSLIYNFKALNSEINNNKYNNADISKFLDEIYRKNYENNSSNNIFYPFSLLFNSNNIGGIKNLPLNIRGYHNLKNSNDLNIGYYLRTNNISNCKDVYLHCLIHPNNKPNHQFSNEEYLKANPDLKDSNITPFLHYILYGKTENRKINNNIKGAFQSRINEKTLTGWIAEIGNNKPLKAIIEIEDKKYPINANIYREDLKRNNINNGKHGFEFKIPEEYNDGEYHKIILIGPENKKIAEMNYNYYKNYDYKDAGKIEGAFQTSIKGTLIRGWIAEIGNNKPLKAIIEIEDKKYPINANIYREDLKRNNINNGKHGFEFKIPEEYVDGNEHKILLVGPDSKVISEIRHIFTNYDYENNFERFLAHSMIEPEIILPADESKKKIFSLMDNMTKYLITQVKNEPLITVIMPVYNREDLVSNAINSVLKQSYKNFELILVNDCSTDNTLQIINSFEDDRIKIINNSTNKGVSKSRNIALQEAKGEYIVYLDSDNDWEKNYIKAVVGAFSILTDADAIYSGQYVYEKDYDNPKFVRFGTINKGLLKNRNYIDLNCFSHKRSTFEKYGGFDEELNRFVDWDLILKYMTLGKIYSVPFLESNYYINLADNSISNNNKYFEQSEKVLEKQIKRLDNKEYSIDMIHNISVIIPSYESLTDLKECLNSLFNLNASWLEIIVVDNNSSEDVIRYLLNLKNQSKIKLILNKENMGFTYAVNQAIEIAEIDNDIVLLNNDAIVTKNALQLLQKGAYEKEDCGLTVPQQILPADTKTINVHVPFANKHIECDVNLSAHHKNVINVPLFHDGEYTELSFAPFFCVYIKRDIYNLSIGLDAELGRHFRSDMIYCNYIRTVLNKKIYHVSEAIVYHKLQKATETLKEKSMEEHNLLYVQNRWSEEEQEKYGFKTAKWDF